MRKGVTAAQNVNTLRWATYYGVDVSWNVIWGFPGETEGDYAEQVKLVSNLTHLNPPSAAGTRIWLERFSPLFMENRGRVSHLQFRRPEESYAYVLSPLRRPGQYRPLLLFQYRLPKHRLDEGVYASSSNRV